MKKRFKECPVCGGCGEITDAQYEERYEGWIRETANAYGITEGQMLAVDQYDCEPRCGAITAKGERCKNSPLSSRTEPGINIWWFLKHHGNYCAVHGGLS